MKLITTIFFMTLIVLGFQNCSQQGFDVASNPASDLQLQSALEQKALAVINNRCASCHNSQNPQGGIDYIADTASLLYYRLIVPNDPGSSILFQTIQSGEMPPNRPLSQSEVDAINQWITSGLTGVDVKAPAPTQPPAGNTLEARFSSIQSRVFAVKCASCHMGGQALGGVSLSTYNSTRSLLTPGIPNSSILYTSLQPGGKMANRVNATELAVIRDWITAGAPNN